MNFPWHKKASQNEKINQYFAPTRGEMMENFWEKLKVVGEENYIHESYPLEDQLDKNGKTLNMDFVIFGDPKTAKKVVLLTAGVHRVEGFPGMAGMMNFIGNQPGFLREGLKEKNVAVVMVPCFNPHGMEHLSRWGHQGEDLNRNYSEDGNIAYDEAPHIQKLEDLRAVISPDKVRSKVRFLVKAGIEILKEGRRLPSSKDSSIFERGTKSLTETVAKGQKIFPKGLFYKGAHTSNNYDVLESFLNEYFLDTPLETLYNVDLHTGLGDYGQYLTFFHGDFELGEWKDYSPAEKPPYTFAKGNLQHCLQHFAEENEMNFQSVTMEIGTVEPTEITRVLGNEIAARKSETESLIEETRDAVLQAFSPSNPEWRTKAVRYQVGLMQTVVQEALDQKLSTVAELGIDTNITPAQKEAKKVNVA